MISPDVVIMTRDELEQVKQVAFKRGVERGRFEEGCDRSNSKARGSEGHLGATESTGSVPSDAAVRPANSNDDDPPEGHDELMQAKYRIPGVMHWRT